MRRLVYYVGMSIDGYIAGPEGQIDFMPVTQDVVDHIVEHYPDTLPTHVRRQLGVDVPNPNFAVGVQGRTTYEPALELGITSPYAHLRQYVVSESLTSSDPEVEVISSDAVDRIRELKSQEGGGGGDVYLMGGGRLAGALLPEIDSLIIKLYPVVAGDGVPLFRTGFSPTQFTLTGTRALSGGMVVLTYART